MSKLLSNLPIENLTKDNDYLNIIDKGDLIKFFLESNQDEFKDIKMFVLYGEWGSGKSTLMKYLEKELKGEFNTFFFEAWEHETDDNLALSLLEFLLNKTQSVAEELAGELIDVAAKLLKGFSKSVKLTFPGLSIDGKQIVETLESEKEKTFLELKKEFKTEFKRWEDCVTKGNENPNFNVVFIDDLDRCEPENVLNLLSALKLFFTYGEKTIFLCGVDKKAVREAVTTRYGEVVKSNEYLEKIFDISFSMPRQNFINRLISQYFSSEEVNEGGMNRKWDEAITDFFIDINFKNPRRIKKVLNKYNILKNIREGQSLAKYIGEIPNIYTDSNQEVSFFETIFVLYFIILDEFYPKISEEIFDMDVKKGKYLNCLESNLSGNTSSNQLRDFFNKNCLKIPLEEISKDMASQGESRLFSPAFYICISPANVKSIISAFPVTREAVKSLIPESNSIDYLFYLYFNKKEDFFIKSKNLSQKSLLRIKNMVSKLL